MVDKERLKEIIQTISKLYPDGEVGYSWKHINEIEDDDVEYIVSDCIEDIS